MQNVHHLIAGSTRKIDRAEPETFIHIFVHKKSKLIEFLEHMTKVYRMQLLITELLGGGGSVELVIMKAEESELSIAE